MINWTQILTTLAPWLGAALLLGVLGYGLTRVSGIAQIVGKVLMVAAGVIFGAAIFLNPSAIGQIIAGIKGGADPYSGVREAAQVAQDVKLLQTEPDSAAASLAFDCELAKAAGQLVNPAWCAQLARARADWNSSDLQATLTGLQALQVKIGLVPQGTMLDTGWFDASGNPILVTATVTTSLQIRTQIEDLKKVLGQGSVITTTVPISGTGAVSTTVAVIASKLPAVEGQLGDPLGTPPAGADGWVQQIYHLPLGLVMAAVLLLAIIVLKPRRG